MANDSRKNNGNNQQYLKVRTSELNKERKKEKERNK
jgi:hypothetical protein